MKFRNQSFCVLLAAMITLAATDTALATGDYNVCKPDGYNADQCTRAHANDGAVDLMDLANHALAAGDKVAAFGAWSLAARSDNNPAAMYRIGAAFFNGDGAPQSDEAAADWFRKAADLGYADGQYSLATLYASGQGVDQSDALAMEWYQKAVDQNQPDAFFALGNVYYNGDGAPQDHKRAAELWRRGAEAGHVKSQINYGWVLYTGEGVAVNYAEAVVWTRKGVAAGNPYAKSNLGEMYEYGRGVPVDLKKAAQLYRESAAAGIKESEKGLARIAAAGGARNGAAAQQSSAVARASEALQSGDFDGGLQILTDAAHAGDFESQVTLGMTYAGIGAPFAFMDIEQARFWMEKAVAQKSKAVAAKLDQQLFTIGAGIRDGAMAPPDIASLFDGVAADPDDAKDYGEAVKWFEMAAALGNSNALIAIGDLYGEGGHGIGRDYAMALQHYKRADAIKSSPLLAYRIGGHYAKGLGVARNDAIAAQWFKKAAVNYPEAELWLARYEIGRKNLRTAMNWLDRFYVVRKENQPLFETYDEILHLYYGALLPPAPAGWTAIIEHQTTPKPIEAAHFSSSDVAYPIIFQRRYKHAANGREYMVRVFLNDFEHAAKMKTEVAQARRYTENMQRQKKDNNSEYVASFRDAISDMYIRFGAYDAFNTTIKSKGGNEALIEVPLNSHIVVRAETVNGNADNSEEVETLKTALRATNLDLIKSAADGHGFYKKNEYGEIYKP